MKLLFVSDTHLGYDCPQSPRVEKRRRGEDFFSNFQRALDAAVAHNVDLVVHGGDLFYRSKIPKPIIERVYTMLLRFAVHDIPIYIVPGNHERSQLPPSLWLEDPRIHIFDEPRVFNVTTPGHSLALAGFPYIRNIKSEFKDIQRALLKGCQGATTKLLICHQLIEGSSVGPTGYTFKKGNGVVSQSDISPDWNALLVGHVHRAQLFSTEAGVPILFAGSVERTSFAEIDETKGYYLLDFDEDGNIDRATFEPLPARPMVRITIPLLTRNRDRIGDHIKKQLEQLSQDAIVKLDFNHQVTRHRVTSQMLRAISPETMNVQLKFPPG